MFTCEYHKATGTWRVYDEDGAWYATCQHLDEANAMCARHNDALWGVPNEDAWRDDEPDYPDEDPEEAAWHDGSEISCRDCPDSECTGHCMSCAYRPF